MVLISAVLFLFNSNSCSMGFSVMDGSKNIPYSTWIFIFASLSCTNKFPSVDVNSMFTVLPGDFTGIDFENSLINLQKISIRMLEIQGFDNHLVNNKRSSSGFDGNADC